MSDHYEVLHLSRDASAEEINAALEPFREKLEGYAPGIVIHDDLIRSNYPDAWNAFLTLSDSESKAAYDRSIRPVQIEIAEVQPAQKKNHLHTFLSYAAAIGLVGIIVFFLALLGSGI